MSTKIISNFMCGVREEVVYCLNINHNSVLLLLLLHGNSWKSIKDAIFLHFNPSLDLFLSLSRTLTLSNLEQFSRSSQAEPLYCSLFSILFILSQSHNFYNIFIKITRPVWIVTSMGTVDTFNLSQFKSVLLLIFMRFLFEQLFSVLVLEQN